MTAGLPAAEGSLLRATTLYGAIARSVLGRYAVYGVNLVSMMVLARLFTPETFGMVASITVFYTLFQLLAEVGLGPAIINLSRLDAEDRDGLFGLTVVAGLVLGGLFLGSSTALLQFYGLPRIDEVVPYLAICLVCSAASIVPNALLLRCQAFFEIARAGVISNLLGTLAAVALVAWIDPLHALALKASVTALASFLVLYERSIGTEFGRPALGSKFSAIRPLLAFSAHQFGFNLVNFFSRNLDNILVGKYLGASPLGTYDRAYQLMRYPLLLLTFAMTPAIQPVVRRHRNDPSAVERIHRRFIFKLSLAGAAAGLLVFLGAEWIVLGVLGSQWQAVTPIVRVLAIAIPVQVVLSTSGSFFQALDRTDLLLRSGIHSAVAMVSATVWGVLQGDLVALAWALVIAFHVNFLQTYTLMYTGIFRVRFPAFIASTVPAAAVALGMALSPHGA